jgi:hypothetical protein
MRKESTDKAGCEQLYLKSLLHALSVCTTAYSSELSGCHIMHITTLTIQFILEYILENLHSPLPSHQFNRHTNGLPYMRNREMQ